MISLLVGRSRSRADCRVVLVCLALFSASPNVHARSANSDEVVAISSVIRTAWETPEKRIRVEPVVVSYGPANSKWAIAGWTQGARGGRALLTFTAGVWTVVLCGGDGLKAAQNIASAGVQADAANVLADDLAAVEKSLSAEHRALLSTFDSVVDMSGKHHEQHHPAQ